MIIPAWVKIAAVVALIVASFTVGASWAARYYKVEQLRGQVASLELGRALSLKLMAFKDYIEPAATKQIAAMGDYFDSLIEETRSAPPEKRVCSDWTVDQRRSMQQHIQTGPNAGHPVTRR